MIGVLAKADVGNDHHLWDLLLDSADRLLHHAIVRVSLASHGIFFFRNTEENDCRNAERADLRAFLCSTVNGQLRDSGHGRDRLRSIFSRAHEYRINQVVWLESSLSNQCAHISVPPESPWTIDWEVHPKLQPCLSVAIQNDRRLRSQDRGW